ncbi:MAG: hypothetical protein ABFD54_18305 [Armatimonadota bacterium]|nr:hypothetical protein [bacterium]
MKTLKTMIITAMLIIATTACWSAGQKSNVKPEWWGKAPGQKSITTGTVANISNTNIAVQTAKNGLKSFIVVEKTKVRVRGQVATIAGVKVGDPVVIRFRLATNNVPTAIVVTVPRPNVRGKVTAISGDIISLKSKDSEANITVDQSTQYKSKGYTGSLADLKVGYRAVASYDETSSGNIARVVTFTPALAKGTVMAVNGSSITIKTVKQLTINLQASTATSVLVRPRVGPNQKGSMADVKVGFPVNIGYEPNKTGSCPLLWVDVLTGS